VEGALVRRHLVRHPNNRIGNFVDTHNVNSSDANNGDAAFCEPRVVSLVALRSISHVMAYAINFDREPRLGAVEI